jgi:glycosyltransferase involved in cell wall biosynthesis
MRNLYRSADAYVSTDLGEALGITRIEAMACGVPIIVPDHTSGPELCGDRGILVGTVRANAYFEGVPCKAPRVSEVVDAVKWLMDNPADRSVMGTNARRFVLSEYDNAVTAACWKQLLDDYEIAEVELK